MTINTREVKDFSEFICKDGLTHEWEVIPLSDTKIIWRCKGCKKSVVKDETE